MTSDCTTRVAPDVVSGHDEICVAYQDDARADDYIRSRYEDDPFGRATHEHQVRTLRRIFGQLKCQRVLEVAPGPARLTVHVPRVEQGVGIEQSAAMIRVAQERLQDFGRNDWQILQGDAFDLPFISGEFDLAMSFKLLRHFDRTDRLRLMHNLRRAVKPGGHVLFDVANAVAYRWIYGKWGLEKGWIDDYWFTRREFCQEASESGFNKVDLYAIQPAIGAQYYCWSRVARLSMGAARAVSRGLEHWPWGEPLEWIAVCRCA